MKSMHIMVDVGAAEKYKAFWINPDKFKDVIHPRDFHDFMYFFSICGKFVISLLSVTVGLKRFNIRQKCVQ